MNTIYTTRSSTVTCKLNRKEKYSLSPHNSTEQLHGRWPTYKTHNTCMKQTKHYSNPDTVYT